MTFLNPTVNQGSNLILSANLLNPLSNSAKIYLYTPSYYPDDVQTRVIVIGSPAAITTNSIYSTTTISSISCSYAASGTAQGAPYIACSITAASTFAINTLINITFGQIRNAPDTRAQSGFSISTFSIDANSNLLQTDSCTGLSVTSSLPNTLTGTLYLATSPYQINQWGEVWVSFTISSPISSSNFLIVTFPSQIKVVQNNFTKVYIGTGIGTGTVITYSITGQSFTIQGTNLFKATYSTPGSSFTLKFQNLVYPPSTMTTGYVQITTY